MKKLFLPIILITLLFCCPCLFAQIDSLATDSLFTGTTESEGILGVSDWTPVFDVLISILTGLLILAMTVHMLYEIFFATKKYVPLSAEAELNARKDAGLPPMTEEEIASCLEQMGNLVDEWSSITAEDGEPRYFITKYSQIKKAKKCLAEIASQHPDSEDVIECYNEIIGGLVSAQQRQFNGSKTYIILTALVGVFASWMSDWEVWPFLTFGMFIFLYILSTMTPQYLLNKKALRGNSGPKFMSGLLMGVLGLVGSARTYTTITKWSDGTETREDDNSETWIALAFSFIITMVLCAFMFVVALVNYVRNYLIHM